MSKESSDYAVELNDGKYSPDLSKNGVYVRYPSSSDISDVYAPIKEHESFHRYDPAAIWTEAEETAVRRKVDWRIMLWACIMFWS